MVREQLVRSFVAKHEFEMPEDLVARGAEEERRSRMLELIRMGIPFEMAERFILPSEAAIDQVRTRMRTTFVLSALAQAEKVFVTEDEFQGRLAELSQQYDMTPEAFESYLEERDMVGQIRAELRQEKVVRLLLEHATIEDVPADQFRALGKDLGMDIHTRHDHEKDEA